MIQCLRKTARIDEYLKSPSDELYVLNYAHLSWQVHSGLTGVVNLKAETFTNMCGCAFILAADSYGEILLAMIQEFKIEKATTNIKQRMKVARALPFAETQEEVNRLLATGGLDAGTGS